MFTSTDAVIDAPVAIKMDCVMNGSRKSVRTAIGRFPMKPVTSDIRLRRPAKQSVGAETVVKYTGLEIVFAGPAVTNVGKSSVTFAKNM